MSNFCGRRPLVVGRSCSDYVDAQGGAVTSVWQCTRKLSAEIPHLALFMAVRNLIGHLFGLASSTFTSSTMMGLTTVSYVRVSYLIKKLERVFLHLFQ